MAQDGQQDGQQVDQMQETPPQVSHADAPGPLGEEHRQSQEMSDAHEYVNDLIEKHSKVSDSGMEEEEEDEEEE